MNPINSYATAMSGLLAATDQIDAAPSNLASSDSQKYKVQDGNLTNASGGNGVASITSDPSPDFIAGKGTEGSDADPARQVVAAMLAKVSYGANAQILKAQNEMTGSLVSINS